MGCNEKAFNDKVYGTFLCMLLAYFQLEVYNFWSLHTIYKGWIEFLRIVKGECVSVYIIQNLLFKIEVLNISLPPKIWDKTSQESNKINGEADTDKEIWYGLSLSVFLSLFVIT